MNCWLFEELAARGGSAGAERRLEVLLKTRRRTAITRTPRTIPQPTTTQLAVCRRRSFTDLVLICFRNRRRRRRGYQVGLAASSRRRLRRLPQLSKPSEPAGVLANDLCAPQGSDDRCDSKEGAKRELILAVLARKLDIYESDNGAHQRSQHDGQ